jgi:SAM-dependent methyltransferase
MSNIEYKAPDIKDYFSKNRIKWDQFYHSERRVIKNLKPQVNMSILDVGCGCGGLGLALKERFDIINYTGVEINKLAAEAAIQMNPDAKFYCGDILDLSSAVLKEKTFDIVFSLSCIDWNTQFEKSLHAIWKHVKPGGYLVATFRLTDQESINDIDRSYQFINYQGKKDGEIASYVVINLSDMIDYFSALDPLEIYGYGYWGAPSATAETPFDRLCFAAISVKKRIEARKDDEVKINLDLPSDILSILKKNMS